ncbi:hypothetical protein A2778_05700 [Candidatus Daviesbacteria bacterium RIFCSPHIGHO2_01_FULL_40_24]|nr:MAG: hypothetical protein UT45_C0001G0068 [Candidatus Daviesbacteria bacterium GW2011_GWA2_39_33]OGE21647.1 MAG: hypothetical protein A2778_05700 [Candidatus Daviesbacteria bacterium RIFCSPHIGHO2_01_FULL_40_24]
MILLFAGGYLYLNNQNSSEDYLPKEQRKNVEAYFVENMRVSPAEATEMASKGVDLRVSKDTTLTGIVGNLYYYGFIDNEKTFTKLLETTADTTSGRENAIKVGNNTIDTNSSYYLNYQMIDKEIADTLLNKGRYSEKFNDYNYLFMPSGPQDSGRRP